MILQTGALWRWEGPKEWESKDKLLGILTLPRYINIFFPSAIGISIISRGAKVDIYTLYQCI